MPRYLMRFNWLNASFHQWFMRIFIFLFVYLGMLTIGDYGPMWDCWEYYIGDKNLAFYMSGNLDYIRDPLVNLPIYQRGDHPDWYTLYGSLQGNDAVTVPHLIWPLGPTLSSLTKLIFWDWLPLFDPIGAQHLVGVFMVALLLAALYRFARERLGLWTAILAVLITATYPRFWAHLHNNVKDIPSAVMFSLVLIVVVEAIRKRSWVQMLVAGVLWGLALAVKANALFVPIVLIPWFLYELLLRWRGKRQLLEPRMVLAIGAVPLIAFPVMLLAWPLLMVDFPDQLLLYIHSLIERGVQTDGAGWTTRPLIDALVTMPLPVMLLLIAGLVAIAMESWRRRRLDPMHLLALTWLVVPVLRVSVPGARDFDVIRHWLEIVPAIGLISGIGGDWVIRRVIVWARRHRFRVPRHWQWRRSWALLLVLLWLSPTIVWNIRNHPYQVVFYNSLIGGLEGARQAELPDANDYWAASYRQGLNWINDNADEDSWLMVGMAEHIVLSVREIWLRPDISLQPVTGRPPEYLIEQIARTGVTTYIMYAVRPEWYHPIVPFLERGAETVHEIEVDGGVILRVLKLTVVREPPPA